MTACSTDNRSSSSSIRCGSLSSSFCSLNDSRRLVDSVAAAAGEALVSFVWAVAEVADEEVDENDVVLVSVGDTANVKVDAFGDRIFHGVVVEIGNSAKATGFGTQEQVVNFSVKINLMDLDPNLRPGMSCNADIETETVKDVISVPIQSVTARTNVPEDNDSTKVEKTKDGETQKSMMKKPKEVVFLADNGKAKMVAVETGISDDNFIEIKSGLKDGEVVISGSYRAISRELENGSIVRVEDKKGGQSNQEMVAEEED